MSSSPNRPSNVLWQEGDEPEPVTPDNPLAGIEVLVLKAWLESSPRLRKAYDKSPQNKHVLESAVRGRVFEEWEASLKLRAEGLTRLVSGYADSHRRRRPPGGD
jgi:hypothetical protein